MTYFDVISILCIHKVNNKIKLEKTFTKSIECWMVVLEPPICFEGPDPSPAFSDRRFWDAFWDKALNSSLGLVTSRAEPSFEHFELGLLIYE